ncbi:GNAT family N-acetyltransferase [Companilactobacillus mishanensis]|uniref:GNAT family N-acetyltransferase n=1 Tax=Companilactobacillus mishanensis TaxID=2486008 RepID=A0ABW9P873_9LACO|nr:GNAT family N-acetyltransferase [Companilactobacillus mishanensis]MQS45353.1 GNAT family N-acetyltransferase [Companilactobacillus mishanensis]
MSDQLTIREAIPDDSEMLIDFLNRVSDQSDFIEHDSIKNLSVEQERESLDEIYESELDELMIAIFENQIIGFSRLEKIDKASSEFGIVVDKDFWHQGIGSYLTEEMLEWSKSAPIKKVTLEVYKNNPAAIQLYKKYGFTTRSRSKKTQIMEKMV